MMLLKLKYRLRVMQGIQVKRKADKFREYFFH